MADLGRGSNSLNSDTGDVTFSDPSLKSDVFESQRYPLSMCLLNDELDSLIITEKLILVMSIK